MADVDVARTMRAFLDSIRGDRDMALVLGAIARRRGFASFREFAAEHPDEALSVAETHVALVAEENEAFGRIRGARAR